MNKIFLVGCQSHAVAVYTEASSEGIDYYYDPNYSLIKAEESLTVSQLVDRLWQSFSVTAPGPQFMSMHIYINQIASVRVASTSVQLL